jgi:RNA polymerase sigma factor (sigma-70 family)
MTSTDTERNAIAEQYLHVLKQEAANLARKHSRRVDVDDLVQAGTFGLLQAIERFNPNHGSSFGAYCRRRVRGAMLDWMRDCGYTSRSKPKQRVLRDTCSIYDRTDYGIFCDLIASNREPQPHIAVDAEDEADKALAWLSRSERMAYTLYHAHDYTQHEIADMIGVGPSMASLIMTDATKQVRAVTGATYAAQ